MSSPDHEEAIVVHPVDPVHDVEPIADPATPIVEPAPITHTFSPAAPVAETPRGDERALGLDAFRGLLMVGMVFSFAILGKAGLPAWMYHMQFPPPAEKYVALAGLTWRDLIFPGFLFTLAAAIPLASAKYLAKNVPYPVIMVAALKRFVLLFVFALLIGHTNPFWTNDYTKLGNLMAIVGFVAAWPLLLARRSNWDEKKFKVFRVVGYLAIAAVLLFLPQVYGNEFSPFRKDNIIHALAFVGLVGVGIWLATRHNVAARMMIVLAVVALKLGAGFPGWVQDLWTERSWLVESWFVELLIIVLPGTVAGELVLRWMRAPNDEAPGWERIRVASIAALCLLLTPVLLIGLYQRWVLETTLAVIALSAAGAAFVHNPRTVREQLIARLFRWGAGFLVIGILLEPFEGGIRKDPQTLSFLTLMTGYSFITLIAVMIGTDISVRGRKWLNPFVLIGRNPLLMYVLFTLFVSHVAYLAEVGDLFTVGPVPALARAVFYTALTSALVWLATRKGVFWRA